jgi:hypothetical protein
MLLCREAVTTKDVGAVTTKEVGTMTTNLAGEDDFPLEEKSTSMKASVECKMEGDEVGMAGVDVDAARGVEVKVEGSPNAGKDVCWNDNDGNNNDDLPSAASDRKKRDQTIRLRFTIKLTPIN